MKTRIFLVAAALLVFASLSLAQPSLVGLYEFTNPLLQTGPTGLCNGEPWPDGTMVHIYADNNHNGPDASDPLLTVGDLAGNWNFNQFPINGALYGFPGGFLADPQLASVGATVNDRIFLTVNCPNGTWQWVSEDLILSLTGGNFSFGDATPINWTCTPCSTPPPTCTADVSVTLNRDPALPIPGPQTATVCAHIMPSPTPAVEIDVPVFNASNVPTVTVTAGCAADPTCTPSTGWVLGPFVFVPTPTPHFVGYISGEPCCVTLHLDYILAVGLSNFAAVAGDNSVTINWTTSSEVNNARFDIVRNGETVGQVASEGSATGHSYTWTDANVHNGTTYSYTLRAIDGNGNPNDLATSAATPSFGAAVITEYALHQNFPNPFNPNTSITFDVVNKNLVTLKVFNAAGQLVGTVVNGEFEAGRHIVNFDATNLTSGLYFYTVKIGNEFSATKKMMLLK